MNENGFRIVIASMPHRDNCVCEIYYRGVQWVEVFKESSETAVQFYDHPDQDYWEFPLNLALEVLQKAKNRFLDLPH